MFMRQVLGGSTALAVSESVASAEISSAKKFKVKTCLHSVSYSGAWRGQSLLTVDQFLVKEKELGYDGVELMCRRPHLSPLDYDDAARQELCSRIEGLGLKLVILGAYTDFSAGMDKPGVPHVEIQATYLGEVARLAHDLGAKMVRVFTGYERNGIPYDEQYRTVVEGLRLGG
jgi:L-ribulose-5-phosphate 3-epimerase